MRKLFQAIRQGNLEIVKEVLQKRPDLISCTAKQPPKKDDGQSLLQVAIKAGCFDIVDYLLDLKADVNFIEAEDCANVWRVPVLHDAINAAIMHTRWNVNSEIYHGVHVFHSKKEADRAYAILKRMIEMGADVNAIDSYGNACVDRACLQARQILPSYYHKTKEIAKDRILTLELIEDLTRIFTLLYENGMDVNYKKPNETQSSKELFQEEPVAQFLSF